jgi:LAS superfamily LD-carboxypeptidase LdcB
VRSVIKQFLLFLNKAYRSKGNLSLASRSLAPPGYSFHGIGDFDVGQTGFGPYNFTARFVTTPVYQMLKERGYLKLRYPAGNLLGVRFEPWHIKIC